MRLAARIATGLAVLLGMLVLLAFVASELFNLATDGEGKPASELWHGRVIDADGVETAYRRWGSHGSPIVLVGGFVEPSFIWNSVGPLLARTHRVYALDLDGFGYSTPRGPWTLGEWGSQVQDFIRKLHLGRPVVVGHSLGAAVAVEVARRRVASRIVLVDGDALRASIIPGAIRGVLADTPFPTTAVRLATRWDWPAGRLLARAYGPVHPPITDAIIDSWTRPLDVKGEEHAVETIALRTLAGFEPSDLQEIHVPATVVWGAHDEVDSRADGMQTARDLHARFVLIRRAGHLSLLTQPAAVARAIEQEAG
jgi:pimeloyl-ACP methyl ester carboxylesterase